MMSEESSDIARRAFQKGVFPVEMAWYLEGPRRKYIMSAEKHADRLKLEHDMQVLEIGPGSGYYSLEVKRRLPDGSLHLLDIQQGMLDLCRKKFERAGLQGVTYHLGSGTELPFDSNTLDRIYMVTVYGEIEHRDAYFKEIGRVLKPDGMLSVSEHKPDPDFTYKWRLVRELRPHGFRPNERFGWFWAYTMNFELEG